MVMMVVGVRSVRAVTTVAAVVLPVTEKVAQEAIVVMPVTVSVSESSAVTLPGMQMSVASVIVTAAIHERLTHRLASRANDNLDA